MVASLVAPTLVTAQPIQTYTFDRERICAGEDRLVVGITDLQDGRLSAHWNFPNPEEEPVDTPTGSSWRLTELDTSYAPPVQRTRAWSISMTEVVRQSGMIFPSSEWEWVWLDLTDLRTPTFGPRHLVAVFGGDTSGNRANLAGLWPEQILYPPYTNLVTIGSAYSAGGRWEVMGNVWCSPAGSRSVSREDSRAGTSVTLYRDSLCAGRVRCTNTYASSWYSW